jgi:hypothetical protein
VVNVGLGIAAIGFFLFVLLVVAGFGYFLNERMFRRKKNAVLDWMTERGWIDEDWGRRKKF